MNLGGAAARFLQGSTAFTGIIAILIVFLTIFGYASSGLGAGRRQSSGVAMALVVLIGLIAIAAFLFPNVIHDIADRFSGLTSR